MVHTKAAVSGADRTAIDADSKLIVSYLIGGRDADAASDFMHDVADRLATRVQLTTDGHAAYLTAVAGAFGLSVCLPPWLRGSRKPFGTLAIS